MVRVGKAEQMASEQDIRVALELVKRMRRKDMSFWGDLDSSTGDIEGKWNYTVRGQDAKGYDYEHSGDCDYRVVGRGVVCEGTRRKTSRRLDGTGEIREIPVSTHWASSPLEFSHEGETERFEFNYRIESEGEPVRGICRCTINRPDQSQPSLEGDIVLIYEHDTVRGKIRFDKPPA